ncbi:MAG: Adenylosuccinate synthetase [Candidatus Thorarchaeota archaeon]|nr:MAG: Adenylosuccinate synthetase [Candidatus Thorarchaeota archaeon]
MSSLIVTGLQWGDEGKGKVVDFLSGRFDIVTRFQGGSNAGHTVKVGDQVFKFRLIPTGAVRGKKAVIGNGVVIDLEILDKEIEDLRRTGISPDFMISNRAHIITPYHIQIDGLQEAMKGKGKVGTTKRGIGPTYADKISRFGIRVQDLLDAQDTDAWNRLIQYTTDKIQNLYESEPGVPSFEALSTLRKLIEKYSSFIGDSGEYLSEALSSGKNILFEGAQGTLLDIDHGTYPFVTSSNCISSAAAIGTGVSFKSLGPVLGICKAYLTRVGEGPFPSELDDEIGVQMLERGGEYGTVTGRARRCGWLDLVALRYAVRLNSAKYLALTKIDVLSGIDSLKLCIAYEIDGKESLTMPASSYQFEKVKPIYREFNGWDDMANEDWTVVNTEGISALDSRIREYIRFIENFTKTKVVILSYGPDRKETSILNDEFLPKYDETR